MRRSHLTYAFLAVIGFTTCSPKSLPYENGPVMSQKSIEKTFQPILEFIDYKPGMLFADVGAGSGALTVMMASLMDNSTVYIQDIDTSVLKEDNLSKIIDFYAKQSGQDIGSRNKFVITIGNIEQTNLPDLAIDLIYSNATVHNFTSLDSMVVDMGRKLRPDGVLFLRDSFKGDHGEGSYCSDPKCGRPLLTIDELLATMKRNGFRLVKQSPDMSGYPIFGFSLIQNVTK
jgi:SAM-dependent methyltransferase